MRLRSQFGLHFGCDPLGLSQQSVSFIPYLFSILDDCSPIAPREISARRKTEDEKYYRRHCAPTVEVSRRSLERVSLGGLPNADSRRGSKPHRLRKSIA